MTLFSELKQGDRFKLSEKGWFTYEKVSDTEFKEVNNIITALINPIPKTITPDNLFIEVFTEKNKV